MKRYRTENANENTSGPMLKGGSIQSWVITWALVVIAVEGVLGSGFAAVERIVYAAMGH